MLQPRLTQIGPAPIKVVRRYRRSPAGRTVRQIRFYQTSSPFVIVGAQMRFDRVATANTTGDKITT